jgi:uncharacterized membrane protein
VASKHVRWLESQIPGLVARGLLPSAAAESLRKHYHASDADWWRRAAVTASSAVGAVLIGLGLIFLAAHNWSDFGRPLRTLLAIGPLAVALGAAVWVAARRPESVAWREGAGTLVMLALAGSIALVQQTYHTPGDASSLVLIAMLLGLPLVYLLDATAPAVLYLAASVLWERFATPVGAEMLIVPLLGVGVLPHFLVAARSGRYGVRSATMAWALGVWAVWAFGRAASPILPAYDDTTWLCASAGVLAILHLVGTIALGDPQVSLWRRPMQLLGAGGVAVCAFVLTFRSFWSYVGWKSDFEESSALYGLFGSLAAAAVVLGAAAAVRRRAGAIVVGLAPLVVLAALVLSLRAERPEQLRHLFNVYVIVLGLGAMVAGFRGRSLGLANAGIVLIALLIVARFFDGHMNFLEKAVVCLSVGGALLAANGIVALRRRRAKGGRP